MVHECVDRPHLLCPACEHAKYGGNMKEDITENERLNMGQKFLEKNFEVKKSLPSTEGLNGRMPTYF